MNKLRSIGTGFGITGLLTIVFIVLKLTGIIGWSWWLVLSPIPIVLFAIAVVVSVLAWLDLREVR